MTRSLRLTKAHSRVALATLTVVMMLATAAVLALAPAADAQQTAGATACWSFDTDFTATNAAFNGTAGPQAAGFGPNDAQVTAANPSPAGGSSLLLDGDGDYLNVGNPLPTTGSYTKTMWVYRAGTNVDTAWENLYTSGDGGGSHALAIDPNQDSNLLVWHRNGTGPGLEAHNTGQAIGMGSWIHVAVVYDAAAGALTTYYNGSAVDTQTVGTLGDSTNPDTIGSYAAMQSWFNGQLDDVCIYSDALSAAQVAAIVTPTTGGEVCTFTGPGGDIPDDDPLTGIESDIVITHAATIASLELEVSGFVHPSVGDLTVILLSPDSNKFVSVMNQAANEDNSNLNGTYTFSDLGASLFTAAAAAGDDDVIPPGTYRASRSDTDAEEFDDQFIGDSTAGTWTVLFSDNTAGNVGSFGGVALKATVSSGGCPTVTPPGGTCNGLAVTINMQTNGGNGNGTPGNDVILGTDQTDFINGGGGDDVICAEGGDDRVRAGAGVDTVFGGPGRDRIWGDDGDDILNGGSEIDRIRGGDGADTINGDGGSDRIWGGEDDDVIAAGSGADRVWGDGGNDNLRGMGGQDFMWGGEGDDEMQGNWQSDRLRGGPGDDIIRGAQGKDKLWGEAGDDDLYGGDNTDFLDGGDGDDFANGQKGKDNPLEIGVSGCIAETKQSC